MLLKRINGDLERLKREMNELDEQYLAKQKEVRRLKKLKKEIENGNQDTPSSIVPLFLKNVKEKT
jgi:sensor histidine kinase YesM